MIVNGIIAEYNPFHNGHQYHLERSRRETGADYNVVVLSSNFTQRGEPAIIDKFTRAKKQAQKVKNPGKSEICQELLTRFKPSRLTATELVMRRG